MNIVSRILIVAFVSISLKSTHADVQATPDSVSPEGIVKVVRKGAIESSGTGFFVDPHTLVTAFHVINDKTSSLIKDISNHLFIVHPITKKHVRVHSIRALDFENDLAVLNIKEYESPVHYKLSEGSPESVASSEAHILNRKNDSFPRFEGKISHQYPSEISFMKTLLFLTLNREDLPGLSGAPVILNDGTVVGVYVGINISTLPGDLGKGRFSDIQNIKNILSKPNLNCKTTECIKEEIYASDSKEAQYRRGVEMIDVESNNMNSDILIKKEERGYYWFEKSARKGFAPAMYLLASWYLGDGNENQILYKKWLTKAAKNNYSPAQEDLSLLLLKEFGKSKEKTGNLKEGIRWAQKAMEQGYFLPLDIFGILVRFKIISKYDYRYYIKDFAKRGHATAQTILAYYFFTRDKSEKNKDKAMNLLLQAVEANYPEAIYYLSLIYEEGLYGIEQNIEKAEILEQKLLSWGYTGSDAKIIDDGAYYVHSAESEFSNAVNKVTSHVQSVVDKVSLACQWVFKN